MNAAAVTCRALACFAALTTASAQTPFPQRTAERSHLIGKDAASGATIGRLGVFTVGRGNVYVLDRADFTVKAYDVAGKFVRAYGGRGAGPGLFRIPDAITINDTAVVVDDRSNGTVVFAHDGRHVVTHPPPARRSLDRALRHGFRLTTELQNYPSTARGAPVQRPTTVAKRLVWLVSPASRADTLVTFPIDAVWFDPVGGRSGMYPSGFGEGGAWGVVGDSVIVLADGYAGMVRWFAVTPTGVQLRRTESLRKVGARITPAEIEAQEVRIIAAMSPTMTVRMSTDTTTVQVQAPITFHPKPERGKMTSFLEFWSVASRVIVGDDGAVWVGAPRDNRNVEGNQATGTLEVKTTVEQNDWTVFPARGAAYVVSLPATFQLRFVRGDTLVGVGNDTEVHVYRVRP